MVRPAQARTQALLWMVGWAFTYSLVGMCIKTLDDLPKLFVILVRFTTTLPLLLATHGGKRWTPPTPQSQHWYLLRVPIGFCAILCTYLTYGKLPITTATAIGYTEPTMQVLFAILLFRTSVTPTQWACLFLAYAGVLVMNYPLAGGTWQWVLVALLANLSAALAKLMGKQILTTEPLHQAMLYGNLLLLALLLPLAGLAIAAHDSPYLPPVFALPPDTLANLSYNQHFYPFLGLIFLGFISQYCYTRALHLADFDLVGMATYLRIPIAACLGWWYAGDQIKQQATIGILMILLANFLLTQLDVVKRKKTIRG